MTQSGFGTIIRETECPYCGGTGQTYGEKCEVCSGSKVVPENKKIHVSIPPGVEDGVHLKVQGAGHVPSTNAIPGDLYLRINIISNENFIRRGNDLYTKVDLDFVDAILGTNIMIPTLDYKNNRIIQKDLKVPSGTQHGTEFRIKSHGASYLRGRGRGDQYVIVNIIIPEKISKKQKEILLKYKELGE